MSLRKPVYYGGYLELDKLLDAQRPLSGNGKRAAHDEMLFIITHQAYELWFKQILHELDSVLEDFSGKTVPESAVGRAVARLSRVVEIQKLLVDQLRVLETMTPLDFLDFRDALTPASGFQSFQFRLIERKLGLIDARRAPFEKSPYFARLAPAHRRLVLAAGKADSLFALVERWLERTPFTRLGGFDFWREYRKAVGAMLDRDERTIRSNPALAPADRERELKALQDTRASFDSLLDPVRHAQLVSEGAWRLSYKATLSALLIELYRDRPILHEPFRFLEKLVEVDEQFALWRTRHALMVHRMIGTKIGTGGSSGHQYLMKAAASHRVFGDLFNLSTFLIPRSSLPKLPKAVAAELGFAREAA
ncbi:MAG TPA: tryptophan 2,3-dioxygenase family protein [Elusimicrobiota bacterium]|nr:tryptophan 2,3-dioxygenase family protein [Elusimicrobiota bacterium]